MRPLATVRHADGDMLIFGDHGCIPCVPVQADIATALGEKCMELVAIILTVLIGLLHGYILVIEMVWWETPRVRKLFGTDADFAARTKAMAANQGLYNGFLAAGLFWGLWQGANGRDMVAFFLICVGVAGIYGAATVSRRIFVLQALPALLALLMFGLASAKAV